MNLWSFTKFAKRFPLPKFPPYGMQSYATSTSMHLCMQVLSMYVDARIHNYLRTLYPLQSPKYLPI